MQDAESQTVEYVLAGAILLGRLGDIGSTWLVTPKLRLEANPIARRFRWPFLWATTLPLCLIPFWYAPAGLTVAVVFLLVTASNLTGVWFSRALGEDRVREIHLEAAQKGRLGPTLAFTWLAALPLVGCTCLLFVFTGGLTAGWGAWGVLGIGMYAIAVAIHRTLYLRRLFRTASERIA